MSRKKCDSVYPPRDRGEEGMFGYRIGNKTAARGVRQKLPPKKGTVTGLP